MSLKVEVTQKDIDIGLRGDCSQCPVALAVSRALIAAGLEYGVGVDELNIKLFRHGMLVHTIRTPKEVAEFIEDFDSRYSVEPFLFEIEVPE